MIEKIIVDEYTKRGWVIHPLSPSDDEGKSPGKRALLNKWTELAKTPVNIEYYLKKGCNIGIVCGKASGVMVIDVDKETFLGDVMDDITLKTLGSHRTKGRGHLYFKYNPTLSSCKHHNLGLEILSDGSNAVLPPSKHHVGDVYEWNNQELPAEMPEKMIENIENLFKLESELNQIIDKCRPCFRKYWADDVKVTHGSTARMFLGAFCSEIYNNGAMLEHIKMFAKVIYNGDYNEKITTSEFKGWTTKGCKPFLCTTIQKQCVGFVNCDICLVGKHARMVPESGYSGVEMELGDILALHSEENERKCVISLPEDHFISVYTKWMSSVSDGYVDYQNLCGLWLLSALTKNRVKLRLKQEVVKPNLWIFNIGKSTTSRKSTIVNKTRKIYETATEKTLFNDDYSIEGYLETLAGQPILNNVRDEAAGLMAKYHKKYNEGILELECAIYDGQSFKKTLASGKDKKPRTFEVASPFVTKLYATTPDNFARYMTVDDFTCGYGFRFLFASPNYKKTRMGLELESTEDVNAWGRVLASVKILHTFFSQCTRDIDFSVSPEAMEYYNKVVCDLENKADELNNDLLNSAIGRSQIHILKIAMLLELGKRQMSFTIQLDTIKIAVDLITSYFLPSLMDLIDRLQEDVKFNQIEKITAVLRKLGGVATHSKVLHDCKIKGKDFSECIETMKDSNTISIIRDVNTKILYYRLLSQIPSKPILSIPQILSIPACEVTPNNRENLENLNKLSMYNDTRARALPITSGVEGSNYTREFREFRELGEFSENLENPTQEKIASFITAQYNSMRKPDSTLDLEQLKRVMATSILLKFDTDEPSRYVSDYCKARGWE